MRYPRTRLWMYSPPDEPDTLEVILLGDAELIAHTFAVLKSTSEQWPGFDRVDVLVHGAVPCGIRATLSTAAAHTDAVAEGYRWLREVAPSIVARLVDGVRIGAVATW